MSDLSRIKISPPIFSQFCVTPNFVLFRTKGSVFADFRIFLLAEHSDGKKFQVVGSKSDVVNIKDEISIDISQKKVYPRFVNNNGSLSYETFSPAPQNMMPQGMVGGPTIFVFDELYLKYQYCFESKIYEKEIRINNKDTIASLLPSLGRNETPWQEYEKH